ncbi:mitochondrial protein [Blumeria hordei DH14]|uniref:Mitochondrial protein n=1 Tax=Blumeria graminis f. sp. hordei (strain DH14) TaxID=546991 RepID=N1JAM3_BLUG1|nr:mitochondrial protein [Blumeria hordei DH14]
MVAKLSPALRALVHAPHTMPGGRPAPSQLRLTYAELRKDAGLHGVGRLAWLTISAATSVALDSPAGFAALYVEATATTDECHSLETAEILRDIAYKCLAFTGIPPTINCLHALRGVLPHQLATRLSKPPMPGPSTTPPVSPGPALWESVYGHVAAPLEEKLAAAHPSLPSYLVHHVYGALLASPQSRVGRVLTSLVAIACLRARLGAAPQLTSHLLGLRRAYTDGSAARDAERGLDGGGSAWLATDDGSTWLLEAVDTLIAAFTVAPASRL